MARKTKFPVLKEPVQARSRATLERLLVATEALLHDRRFTDISVAEIVEQAASSVGAFYKRFSSKDDLLPYLLKRLQDRQLGAIEAFVIDPRWNGVDLGARIDAFIDIVADSYRSNRGLVRALVTRQFSDRAELPPDEIRKARRIVDLVAGWLLECRADIRHDDPEAAVRVAMFMALTSLQVALLFRPATRRFPDSILISEIKRTLRAGLQSRVVGDS